MKKTFKLLAVGLLVSGLLFNSSCSKDKEAEELSQKIQNIIPEETVKELEAKGLKIHRGNKPPIVDGVFEVDPFVSQDQRVVDHDRLHQCRMV